MFNSLKKFKADPFGFKAKKEKALAEKAEQAELENFKRENITPSDERYQVLPEKSRWITAFAKNYVSTAVRMVDQFKKESLKGKALTIGLLGAVGVSTGVWGAVAIPAAATGLISLIETVGKVSKMAWRDKLYKKQIRFENKVNSHTGFKSDFSNKLVDLRAEFSRNIALAYKHYENIAAEGKLSNSQQEAFQIVKSAAIAQNIDVTSASARQESAITPIELEDDLYDTPAFGYRELNSKSLAVEKALNKFQAAWIKVEKTSSSAGSWTQVNRNHALTKKLADTAQKIEDIEQQFTEWNQKSLVHEVRLYDESIRRQSEVENLMPSVKTAQDTLVSTLQDRGEDVFEAAYLLGNMKDFPIITRDAFGDSDSIEQAEKSPNTLAEKFVAGATAKIDSLLQSPDNKHFTMRLKEDLPNEMFDRARNFVERASMSIPA